MKTKKIYFFNYKTWNSANHRKMYKLKGISEEIYCHASWRLKNAEVNFQDTTCSLKTT